MDTALKDKEIAYAVRKSKRAKRMRLAVYCDGSIVVTAPFTLQENEVHKFVSEKMNWVLSKIDYFKKFKHINIGPNNRRDYLENKEKALCLIKERIAYFSQEGGYSYTKIKIKRHKSRWGSCSRMGNLNFNYKIIFLPAKIRDYIVVHEFCHLKEFNHSRHFWDLVEGIVPDYRKTRKELRRLKFIV